MKRTMVALLSIALGTLPIACVVSPGDGQEGSVEIDQQAVTSDGGAGTDSSSTPSPPPPPPIPYPYPAGDCQDYAGGGTTHVHFYTCCNNCPSNPTSGPYQGGSSGSYCGTCGTPTGGGWPIGSPYSCGGLTAQNACRDSCNAIAPTQPGSCWDWQDCFDQCCGVQSSKPPPSCPKDAGSSG